MLRLALVALVVTSACRYSLEDDGGGAPPDGGRLCKVIETSMTCADAVTHQNLAWIETNVFSPNCGGTSCHGQAPTPGGRIVLTTASYGKLVGADSQLAPGRKLVIGGSINQSYLMVLLRHISLGEADPAPAPAPPSDPGYMPVNSDPICCQKLDAIARWIEGGAQNN
ncbi:MAG TPA: hypothetical protein VN253_26810 [Kofleriaceae bacterium]|nr:hypothetical protein [Kofleriaceae bacterium]